MNESDSNWKNVDYQAISKIMGRCRHSTAVSKGKVYSFGGSYMYNRKRQIRECINQVMVFDTANNSINIIKTKGISVQPRKDHCCSIYGNSMIVFGGQY